MLVPRKGNGAGRLDALSSCISVEGSLSSWLPCFGILLLGSVHLAFGMRVLGVGLDGAGVSGGKGGRMEMD